MRREEIVKLRWDQIDGDKNVIPIRCREDFLPKGNRERTLSLTGELNSLLRNVQRMQIEQEIDSDYVFLDEKGRKLTGDRVYRELKNAIRDCELRDELDFTRFVGRQPLLCYMRGYPFTLSKPYLGTPT